MVATIGTLSDIASPEYGEDGEDRDEEEAGQGKMSEDDEPGWVICTITNIIQQCIKRFWQKQMKHVKLTQLRWWDTAEYFCENNQKYGTPELRVSAVVYTQMAHDAAAHAPTTFGELLDCLEIVPRISQIPQGTSPPGSSHMRLGSVKPQSNTGIPCVAPAVESAF